jgi:hypothetical protein
MTQNILRLHVQRTQASNGCLIPGAIRVADSVPPIFDGCEEAGAASLSEADADESGTELHPASARTESLDTGARDPSSLRRTAFDVRLRKLLRLV